MLAARPSSEERLDAANMDSCEGALELCAEYDKLGCLAAALVSKERRASEMRARK